MDPFAASPPIPPHRQTARTVEEDRIQAAVRRGVVQLNLTRKAHIARLLQQEREDGGMTAPPASAVLYVDDETFCIEDRPICGYYERVEGVKNPSYRRIDREQHPWEIVRNHNGRWWFTTHGEGRVQYIIPYESIGDGEELVPPARGWVTYSALSSDHCMFMDSSPSIRVLRN